MSSDRNSPPRPNLAVVGGFVRPRETVAQGTLQAAYQTCAAIAKCGDYREIHVYQETGAHLGARGELALPPSPTCRTFDKLALIETGERYRAIYVANGEHIGPVPSLLRPRDDWAPLVFSIGTTHAAAQWQSLLVSLATESVRATDGFIFKSRAAERLFQEVWRAWSNRFGFATRAPGPTVVIGNGVDAVLNRRSESLRAATRKKIRLRDDDVLFLAFSRLSPGTKGDQRALVTRWKTVVASAPQAVLVLSGAQVDRRFVAELRSLAQAAGVGDRVLVLENPFELFANARLGLMSAADAFIHLSTGAEEASPLVVQEALAHGLPVVATAWAGLPEMVSEGENGFLVATTAAPVPVRFNEGLFGVTDLPISLGASRSVITDFDQVVDRVVQLCEPSLRARFGAAARTRAEAHDLAAMAKAYLGFFDETSAAAADAVVSIPRPLVTMDEVLLAQGARPLDPSARFRLAAHENLGYLSDEWDGPSIAEASAIVEGLGAGPLTFDEIAQRLARRSSVHVVSDDRARRAASETMVRLINFGIVEPDPIS